MGSGVSRAKKFAVGCAAVCAALVVIGVIYEQIARHRARLRYPPAGQLVDTGLGPALQIDCQGRGSPTVVFESGLDPSGSLSWRTVQKAVATRTRACAYSRAGILWSDPDEGAFDARRTAQELRAALSAAGEKPPFVLTGHSIGGPYVLTFTGVFPADVVGIVLVDTTHPDQFARVDEAIGKSDVNTPPRALPILAALSWSGLGRLLVPPLEDGIKLPPELHAINHAYIGTSLRGIVREIDAIPNTLAIAGRYRNLGDRPLMVLTATQHLSDDMRRLIGLTTEQAQRLASTWKTLQNEEASWSRRSGHREVGASSHYMQVDRPDVVIEAVNTVVDQVRAGTPAASVAPTG